jgi:hypothetical protein
MIDSLSDAVLFLVCYFAIGVIVSFISYKLKFCKDPITSLSIVVCVVFKHCLLCARVYFPAFLGLWINMFGRKKQPKSDPKPQEIEVEGVVCGLQRSFKVGLEWHNDVMRQA